MDEEKLSLAEFVYLSINYLVVAIALSLAYLGKYEASLLSFILFVVIQINRKIRAEK